MRIALDAGHGLYTAGKRCLKALDPAETREWQLNQRVATYATDLLEAAGHDVLRVDDVTGQRDIALSERARHANVWRADVYISIHHNAGLAGRSGGGTVVFYYSSKRARLQQAAALYNTLMRETGLRGNRSTPVIKKGFAVLKKTKMPAFLIENGFMDSPTDVPIILSDEHATKTAKAIAAFCKSYKEV